MPFDGLLWSISSKKVELVLEGVRDSGIIFAPNMDKKIQPPFGRVVEDVYPVVLAGELQPFPGVVAIV